MMPCPDCGAALSERRRALEYAEALVPDVILVGIVVRTCPCGHEETDIPAIDALHEVIVRLRPARAGALRLVYRDGAWGPATPT
jgi:hypothetical protein